MLFSDAIKNSQVDHWGDTHVNSGSTNPNPVLQILTAADVVLVETDLDVAALTAAAGAGVASLRRTAGAAWVGHEETAGASGTAAKGYIVNRDGTVAGQMTVSVTGGGGEIELADLAIASGLLVRYTATPTVTHD